MPYSFPRLFPAAFLLALAALPLASCHDPFQHTQEVKAQYLGLPGHTCAVLVSTPDHVLDPDAANEIGAAITQRIIDNVKGVKMLPYSNSRTFVENHPYWTTQPPSAIQKALGVQRLIVVDMAEFKTHEEGSNGELLQGMASGYIRVLEAENHDPDRFSFSHLATSNYPPLRLASEGTPDGFGELSQASVHFRLIQVFSRDTAGAFYDHEETH